jgi:hypothetical protein
MTFLSRSVFGIEMLYLPKPAPERNLDVTSVRLIVAMG